MTASPSPTSSTTRFDPETVAILDAEWPRLVTRFLKFARKRTGSPAIASAVVADAFHAIRAGKRRWDRSRVPSLFTFGCGVIRSLASHGRALEARYADLGDGAGELADGAALDGDSTPDDAASAVPDPQAANMKREQLEAQRALLLAAHARLAGDPVARGRLDLVLAGEDLDPREAAERLGVPVVEVYKAMRRMERTLLALAAEAPARREGLWRAPRTLVPVLEELVEVPIEALTDEEIEEDLVREGFDVDDEKRRALALVLRAQRPARGVVRYVAPLALVVVCAAAAALALLR